MAIDKLKKGDANSYDGLTKQSNKLSGSAYYFTYGKTVVVCADLHISSQISAGERLFSGCPIPYRLKPTATTQMGYYGFVARTNGTSRVILFGNGDLYALDAISTGYVAIVLNYIAE